MKHLVALSLGLILLGGCNVAIPNGLFGCGQQSDCPSEYFCWSSDSRCYDAQEPGCVPKSCDQVMGEFAALGIPIDCGSLPDGCEGSIDCGGCPKGTQCGANGQNFTCGCEELTCATFGPGAECGTIQTRCGGTEGPIDCGQCFGQQVCVDNECVCPAGINCDLGCGTCPAGEICVAGECCAPTFPCAQNECSPPGGLDDGCGGQAQCPPCANGDQCVLSDNLTFECLGDCTCQAQGVECGSTTICGQPTLCGSCQDNGFENGFRCSSGRCVCDDPFEYNDTFENFSLICGGSTGLNCMQDAWGVQLQATLHHEKDIDYYALEVLDAETVLVAEVFEGRGRYLVHMTYICPNGELGIKACSGSSDDLEGITFCVEDVRTPGDLVGLARYCEPSSASAMGTVLVSVRAKEFAGDCDSYGLKILATYGVAQTF
jgi:hypothetical protein